jgi:uncharacterized protein (TIGR00730 family)
MIQHRFLRERSVLVLEPRGALKADDFTALAAAVDPVIEEQGELAGLLIDAPSFPGWESFAALVSHLRFVRDHHRSIRRVAVVSDSKLLAVAPKLAKHFVGAEVRTFAAAERDAALEWIGASEERATDDSDVVYLEDQERTLEIVAQSVLGLWDVVNNLTRLRPARRDRYRVTIFGSARVQPDHWAYAAVRDMAAELARLGCTIVTGGGPGLMQAANEGAALAEPGGGGKRSTGIRVHLPFEQDVNPFVEEVYEHRTFFSRLHHFVLASDAFIVVPGGIGTVLELMLVWQLLQVRKLTDTPLVLVGGMWSELVAWHRKAMLRPEAPLASEAVMDIPVCVPGAVEAIAIVRAHHAAWKQHVPA